MLGNVQGLSQLPSPSFSAIGGQVRVLLVCNTDARVASLNSMLLNMPNSGRDQTPLNSVVAGFQDHASRAVVRRVGYVLVNQKLLPDNSPQVTSSR
jgi:hypothetical protein